MRQTVLATLILCLWRGAIAQGEITLPLISTNKVSTPQAAACVELNLARNRFVIGGLDNFGTATPAQDGYCAADQVFQTDVKIDNGPANRGPLECPPVHFVNVGMGDKLCAFMVRQNAAIVSLADKIDALNQKIDNAAKHGPSAPRSNKMKKPVQ